jgi:uncharacterized protein (DUF1800 family)
VQWLLNPPEDDAQFPRPEWAVPENKNEVRREIRAAADEETRQMMRRMERREAMKEITDLRTWWIDRMRESPAPLREKMTLFWHGHFATSMEKVRDPYLLWLQNETFRRHALGNLEDLVKAVSRDPAMMVYLDMVQSRRKRPNENFARELMELFTLGEGNYTEDDIRNAARAFTGYKIDQRVQAFYFVKDSHDDGEKTFFGRKGRFDGDQIIEIILSRPECGRFLARKIWTFFAYEDPAETLVQDLGEAFRKSGYQIAELLGIIFRSREFYSERSYRTQIKSPVQWIVQTSKELETDFGMPRLILGALRQMGQTLFAPPNVKGWDGGKSWISTSTLLFRYNLANAIVNGDLEGVASGEGNPVRRIGRRGRPVDVTRIAPPDVRKDPRKLVDSLCIRLFQDPLGDKEREAFYRYAETRDVATDDTDVRGLLHLMMSTPQFQLC